jgi:23S rRNA pseudouridine2605 synthase
MKPVPLARALSKLRLLSRAQAMAAIRAGRVRVNGTIVSNPAAPVVPERVRIAIDGASRPPPAWETIAFYKPRGVVTTRRDPDGRPTVFDVLGSAADGLVAVGRLDVATSGLLLLTSDTRLANWLTDPANAVPRVYVVTVRGRIEPATLDRLRAGIESGSDRLTASAATLRKSSARESHLTIELREGRNREVRRLLESAGHEVTRLKRVQFGTLTLGGLRPGEWRRLSRADVNTHLRSRSEALYRTKIY